jgi:hypothetical protein
MRIAQVAPLRERVPPPMSGAIKLVVGLLIDELVTRSAEIVPFGSAYLMISAEFRLNSSSNIVMRS